METAVSPPCIEEAEGCMCPLIQKLTEFKKMKEHNKALKKLHRCHPKLNKCHPTCSTPEPNCGTEENNVLCPIVQEVVDCWGNATCCSSLDDMKLLREIETTLRTVTKCGVVVTPQPQPCE